MLPWGIPWVIVWVGILRVGCVSIVVGFGVGFEEVGCLCCEVVVVL